MSLNRYGTAAVEVIVVLLGGATCIGCSGRSSALLQVLSDVGPEHSGQDHGPRDGDSSEDVPDGTIDTEAGQASCSGIRLCLGDFAFLECTRHGEWVQEACAVEHYCEAGECIPFACSPASLSCEGSLLLVCDTKGAMIAAEIDCGGFGATCIEGQCSPCMPDCGGKSCGDDLCGGSCGECDDSDPCTQDSCFEGQCHHDALDSCCSSDQQCDDGNTCTQDFCLATSSCAHPLVSPCCGNGIPENGESCDDGNNVPGDGCSDVCILETLCPQGFLVVHDLCWGIYAASPGKSYEDFCASNGLTPLSIVDNAFEGVILTPELLTDLVTAAECVVLPEGACGSQVGSPGGCVLWNPAVYSCHHKGLWGPYHNCLGYDECYGTCPCPIHPLIPCGPFTAQ